MSLLVVLVILNIFPNISETEIKRYLSKPKYVLAFPTPVKSYYYRVKLYNDENQLHTSVSLNANTVVHLLKRKAKRSKILVTLPFYAIGWVNSKSLVKIAAYNTIYYESPKLKIASGYFQKGTYFKVEKFIGKAAKVKLHNQTSLTVYVPKDVVSTNFKPHKTKKLKFNSRWSSQVYQCSKGYLFRTSALKHKSAYMHKTSMVKIIERKNGKVKIEPANYYYLHFNYWVSAKRLSKKHYYYYKYSYYFGASNLFSKKFYHGTFQLKNNISAYLNKSDVKPTIILRKDLPISSVTYLGNNLFEITYSSKRLKHKFKFVDMLDLFDQNTIQQPSSLISLIQSISNNKFHKKRKYILNYYSYRYENKVYAHLNITNFQF